MSGPTGKAIIASLLATLILPTLGYAEGVLGGPGGLATTTPGFLIEEVLLTTPEGAPLALRYPTSLAFRGGDLLIVEGGRYAFAAPFEPHLAEGRILAVSLDGASGTARPLAEALADPVGIAVDGAGRIFFTHYGRISILGEDGTLTDYTVGLPPNTADLVYAPVDDGGAVGDLVLSTGQGDLIDVNTTGAYSLAFAPDGTLFSTQAANGRPPDDPGFGGRDYGTDYSSSILRPAPGIVDPSIVYARGCRNCYDLAVTPEGALYASENVGFYRARLQAGSHRTALEGSSLLDANHLDSIVLVTEGQVRRVATILPDSVTLGAAPTGLALAPPGFPSLTSSRLAVAIYSGIPESSPEDGADDRGYVAFVEPEPVTGAGTVVPFLTGLDFPTDLTFGPDGALYVVEYFSGRLFRVTPLGGGA
ncbi:MAG TPA: hypothetical protein VNZ52_07385 [Candidatus Thermoplasmatota archaeon]|nr:hypothetical protein [Candidatus Thermoplasmatota archaeon]